MDLFTMWKFSRDIQRNGRSAIERKIRETGKRNDRISYHAARGVRDWHGKGDGSCMRTAQRFLTFYWFAWITSLSSQKLDLFAVIA